MTFEVFDDLCSHLPSKARLLRSSPLLRSVPQICYAPVVTLSIPSPPELLGIYTCHPLSLDATLCNLWTNPPPHCLQTILLEKIGVWECCPGQLLTSISRMAPLTPTHKHLKQFSSLQITNVICLCNWFPSDGRFLITWNFILVCFFKELVHSCSWQTLNNYWF